VLLRTNTKGCKESQLDGLLLRVRSRQVTDTVVLYVQSPNELRQKVKPSPEAVVVVKGHETVRGMLGIGTRNQLSCRHKLVGRLVRQIELGGKGYGSNGT
jgi:hypothetical protein